ncbi:DUF3558 domain-containing protein [Saccharothrix sp. 6-C]|uniref:DUF3558 domain-containing protein n=1 Tax=Saccharothrix sp. 6-C TaxID=2781735 RepID=UPI0019175C42|nr:DUF3558 domain-containing protein [Saccharothrix sp. 6-C]QQQ76260.1 DUF3558 domain-containing protein [Saccharothrix sp. 6-C]
MLRSSKALVALVLTAGAVLAGCTQKEPGDATSAAPATGSTTAPETSESPVDFPPRPADIKVDGIADACATLTEDQQRELGIDAAHGQQMDVIEDREMPGCSFRANSRPLFSYEVTLISDEGAGYWQGGGNLDVVSKTVAGYGAVQVTLAGTSKADCALAVDVADGQQVFVSFLPVGDGFTQDEMCRNAAKGAEMVMTTLKTLK